MTSNLGYYMCFLIFFCGRSMLINFCCKRSIISTPCFDEYNAVCLWRQDQSCETIRVWQLDLNQFVSVEQGARREFWARNHIFSHRFAACARSSHAPKIVHNLNTHTHIYSRERILFASAEEREVMKDVRRMYLYSLCTSASRCVVHSDRAQIHPSWRREVMYLCYGDVWWARAERESALSG